MQSTSINTNNQYPVIAPLPVGNVLGPIHMLNSDVLSVILANANEPSLLAARLVSKEWNKIIGDDRDLLSKVKNKVAFGPEDWAKHMGIRISDEDIKAAYVMLPENIEQILNTLCPVFPESGKLVKDTHMLVYIPSSVNGKDINGNEITKEITLSSLGDLVEKRLSKEGGSRRVAGYRYIWDKVLEKLDKPVEEVHWMLMTKDVLGGMDTGVNGSRGKTYTVQQEMVKKLSKDSDVDYVVPKTLEAVAAIISQFLRTNEHLFGQGDRLWTYTRCEENIGGYQLVVGGFAPVGLYVLSNVDCGVSGVAGLRKFFLGS